jgi:hypothetical protein
MKGHGARLCWMMKALFEASTTTTWKSDRGWDSLSR